MQSLFRSEAIEQLSAVREGSPITAAVASWRLVLGMAGGGLAAALVVLALLKFDQRIRTDGVVEPRSGLVMVPAPMDGTVSRITVANLQAVTQGAPLLELSATLLEPHLDRAQRRRRDAIRNEIREIEERRHSRRRELGAAEQLLVDQRESLRSAHSNVVEEFALQQQRVGLAETELPEMRALGERGLISRTQVRAAESQALEQRMQSSRLRREQTGLQRDIAAIERDSANLRTRVREDELSLSQRLAELHSERARLRREQHTRVHAPATGVIAAVLATPGQSVSRGQPLIALAKDSNNLVVMLLVSADSPGRVDVGAQVVMRSAAFPPARYGYLKGAVLAVSGYALTPEQIAASGRGGSSKDASYEVLVGLDGPSAHGAIRLIPGMRLEADIVLRRRRVIDLLLEPLLSGLQELRG